MWQSIENDLNLSFMIDKVNDFAYTIFEWWNYEESTFKLNCQLNAWLHYKNEYDFKIINIITLFD